MEMNEAVSPTVAIAAGAKGAHCVGSRRENQENARRHAGGTIGCSPGMW
jgi:hypothetical protein